MGDKLSVLRFLSCERKKAWQRKVAGGLPKLKGEFALGAKRTRPLSVAWTAFRLFPRAAPAFPGASAAQCRGWLREG
jgi:hypothetical protein